MCGWDGDVDGDDCGIEPVLFVESGWGDDGVDLCIAEFDDGLFGDGDGWGDALFDAGGGDGDGESVAVCGCEFGDDLSGWIGVVDGDVGCSEPFLFVESRGSDDSVDHGVAGVDDGLYGDGHGWCHDVLGAGFGDGDGAGGDCGAVEWGDECLSRVSGGVDGDGGRGWPVQLYVPQRSECGAGGGPREYVHDCGGGCR